MHWPKILRKALICTFRRCSRKWCAMGWFAQRGVDCLERTLAGVEWVARHTQGAPLQPAHLEVGIKGENAAYFYLRRKGYIVVARRWAAGSLPGDIDLIA